MGIIAGILALIIWFYLLVVIDEKFGRLAAALWFFIGAPISMFAVIWVFGMHGWSVGGGDAPSCYQNQFGTYCD